MLWRARAAPPARTAAPSSVQERKGESGERKRVMRIPRGHVEVVLLKGQIKFAGSGCGAARGIGV